MAEYYSSQGTAYFRKGESDKAIECHLKRLEIRKEIFGEKDDGVAVAYHDIGTNYLVTGEYEKAIECYLKCLEIRKSLYGENNYKTREVERYINSIRLINRNEQEMPEI